MKTIAQYLCLSAVPVSDKITLVKLLGKIPGLVCPLLPPKTLLSAEEGMKFGLLILGNNIKIVATRCQILRLKCTKIDFGWGSPPDRAGELTALPRPPSWIKGTYL